MEYVYKILNNTFLVCSEYTELRFLRKTFSRLSSSWHGAWSQVWVLDPDNMRAVPRPLSPRVLGYAFFWQTYSVYCLIPKPEIRLRGIIPKKFSEKILQNRTCEPVSTHWSGCPVNVFQKRIHRSAVPPPEDSKPCYTHTKKNSILMSYYRGQNLLRQFVFTPPKTSLVKMLVAPHPSRCQCFCCAFFTNIWLFSEKRKKREKNRKSMIYKPGLYTTSIYC